MSSRRAASRLDASMSWHQLHLGRSWSKSALFNNSGYKTITTTFALSGLIGWLIDTFAICQAFTVWDQGDDGIHYIITVHYTLWFLLFVSLIVYASQRSDVLYSSKAQIDCRFAAAWVGTHFVILQVEGFERLMGWRRSLWFISVFWLPWFSCFMILAAWRCYSNDAASLRWSTFKTRTEETSHLEPYRDAEEESDEVDLEPFQDFPEDERAGGPLASEVRLHTQLRNSAQGDWEIGRSSSSAGRRVDNILLSTPDDHHVQSLLSEPEQEIHVPLPTTSSYWTSFTGREIGFLIIGPILFKLWTFTVMMFTWNCYESTWSWTFPLALVSLTADLSTLLTPKLSLFLARSPSLPLALTTTTSLLSAMIALISMLWTTSNWTCKAPSSVGGIQTWEPAGSFFTMIPLANIAILLQLLHWVRTWTSSTAARDWLMLKVQRD